MKTYPTRLTEPRVRWTTLSDRATLTCPEVSRLPIGSRRSVEFLPGVFVTVLKTSSGWVLLSRAGISDHALAGQRSASRVPVDWDAAA